jgi:hypothetical protein
MKNDYTIRRTPRMLALEKLIDEAYERYHERQIAIHNYAMASKRLKRIEINVLKRALRDETAERVTHLIL